MGNWRKFANPLAPDDLVEMQEQQLKELARDCLAKISPENTLRATELIFSKIDVLREVAKEYLERLEKQNEHQNSNT